MTKEKSDKSKHIKTDKKKDDYSYEELKHQAEEYLAGWQRAQADYQNLKKETEAKVSGMRDFAKGELLINFLPIYSNLLAAFAHIPESEKNNDWAVGFSHIKKQLEDFLTSQGLERIATIGEDFDHDIHEAIETEWQAGKREGEIIREISPGYRLDGNILLHPKVVVNRKK